ncbi:efflux transporter outer membrane subunit [Rheinheimera texasensis]|uniref:efflux transporter outer membrane subunit n=1 Tax=Rheinheimera texasensis TaxID=306205 RepID=UPI0012FF4FFA|nr:efflux transporter outer membrane subunit [Rheinheimera texasensis]
MKKKHISLAVMLASVIGVSGCSSAQLNNRQDLNLPDSYISDLKINQNINGINQLSIEWWLNFNDPAMTNLIERSLENNSDILKAVARIEQANALSRVIETAEVPNVELKTSGTRSKANDQAKGNQVSNTFSASLSSAFEIDFWGKLHHETEAARAQTLATTYAAEVVRQTIATQVAQTYLKLLTTDLQIELTQRNIQSYIENYKLQQLKFTQGQIGQLELKQAEIQQIDANVQLKELKQQQSLLISKLSVLAADPLIDLSQRAKSLPETPAYPALGVPSELLSRRPDVRQAEQQLIAANSKIQVAEAARLPSFSLISSGGGESATLKNLLSNPSEVWSFGPSIDVPIFDSGRRRAAVEQAIAERKAAEADYRSAVYVALQDVSDALTNIKFADSSQADTEAKLQAATIALSLSNARYDAGYSSFSEVLEAERTVNSSEMQLLNNRQAQLIAMIDLFKSLGGGWSST